MAEANATLRINAVGNFNNLIGEVSKFRSQLQSLKLPDKITAKLEKGFDNVESKVGHFQALLNKGITTKSDFTKLVSSAHAAETAITSLKNDIKSIDDKDIQVAVANSADIKKAEAALEKILNMEKQLSSFGTSKGQGVFGEKEVANMQKIANTSEGLRKRFQEVQNSIKSGNIDQASAAIEKLIAHAQKYQAIAEKNGRDTSKWDNTIKWAEGAQNQIEGMVAKANQAKVAFDQLQTNKFNQMKVSVDGIATGFNNVANSAKQAINATTEMASRTNQLNEQVGHLRTQANYFFGLQNMGRLIARGIREAAESVRDLDKAMTETAVVTDFSVSDMWKMLPEYTALANKLGATTQGAYETMTLYFQQGLNKQQTFEIGEETMKMARIAGLDYAQTTNMMTAALRGFNMELNQTSAKRVNDVYSELAAITASDTRELGLAMERTASIAHSAGMDFGNTTAFLAQMIETTREAPENLGTAMKTIIARFQELKQNPYEISEVEGEEVDFNRVDKALKTIGVDLMDNRDKFRDLDDVFLDISERWDGLSQTQQRYIATIAAGARQQSRFLAMVQNYDRLKQLTDAAANSEGASEIQFSKTLESYEAKVNKLKNAWQQYTMELANNQAIKKAIDWLKTILEYGNKIVKAFGKVGSVFGDFGQGLAEMTASFGLGALGFKGLKGGANLGLKLLGGMTVKGATAGSGMFPGGERGSAGFASKISNPIVAAINRLTSVVSGQASKMPSFQNAKQRSDLIKERRQNLYGVTKEITPKPTQPGSLENTIFGSQRYKKTTKAFNASDIRRQFSGLNLMEQKQIYKSVPAIRKALQNGYAEAYKGLNLDKAGQEALTKHFKQVDDAVKSGKISAADAFRHLYNPASVAQAIDNPEVTKALNNAVEQQMKSWGTQKHAKISTRLKQMADERGLTGDKRQQFYKNQKRQIAGQELGISNQNTAQLGKIAGAMTTISSKAALAGQSVMGLGMALDSIGMHGAGAALTTVGNGLIGIGMAAEGASAGVGKLKEAFGLLGKNPMGAGVAAIAGIGIAVAGGFAIAHKKMVKEAQQAGKKVVETYKNTVDKTEKELKNLSEYEENWKIWSAGVDENGNNISLGTGEYEDYLKAVKEITQAHPELIKGYNALGNAIVDNNTVLEKARKLTQNEADKAKEKYLAPESYEKIRIRQKSTKRWQNANEGAGLDRVLWGRSAASTYKVQAQEALDALRQIKGADKILKDFGVTWDETGNITEQGIELIRTKGSDLVSAIKADVGDSDKELNKLVTGASDKVAAFGKTVKGLEDVSKDTYDWGIEYASSKGYDKIDSGLIAPFQTAIERLAEKGLDESEFTNQIDIIGQKYQDLGGHLEDFQRIQEEVSEAQKELGESADFDAYTDTVDVATAEMDSWIAELRSSKDEADHILAEWLVNQKTAMRDYSQKAVQDLSEGLNQDQNLFKSSAEASTRYESIKKQIVDYSSGLNSMKAILDDAMTDQNLEGNGSLTFEQASMSIVGEDFVKKNANNMGKVKDQMKEYQSWLQDSEGNTRSLEDTYTSFWDHITQKAMESPNKTMDGISGKLSDFFVETEDGLVANAEKWSQLNDEQMNSLAEQGFDMSGDWMSSMLNIGRQLGYYTSYNMDMVKQGLVEQNGQGSAVGTDNTIYKRESDLREESRLAMNSEAETEKIVAEAGKSGIKLIGDVADMSGKSIKKMMDNLEVSGEKSGENFGNNFVKKFEGLNYNKEETSEAIDKALSSKYFTDEEKASLQETQANLNQVWEDILSDKEIGLGEEDKSVEESINDHAGNIESMLGQQLAAEGKLSKDAYTNAEGNGLGYAALQNVLGEKGKDTMAQVFASGKDAAGNKLTDDQYNNYFNQLQNLRQHYQEQKAMFETNAANTSGADKKWWEGQAAYYGQAIGYLDNYIQKGQEAHDGKIQQNKEEQDSNNQKTENEINNNNRQAESSEQLSQKEKENKLMESYNSAIEGGDSSEEAKQKILEEAEALGITKERLQELQNKAADFSSTGGLINSLGDVQKFTLFDKGFNDIISNANLTDQQVAQLGNTLNNMSPDQLNNLTKADFGQLLGNLNLTDQQIRQLETTNPEIAFQANTEEIGKAGEEADRAANKERKIKYDADTTEVEKANKKADEPTKEKKKITYEAEVTKKTQVETEVKDKAKKDLIQDKLQDQKSTVTNSVTLNSSVTNPEEPKQKIKTSLPNPYEGTVNATLTLSASVNSGNLKGKIQKAAANASKGAKVKAKTTTTVTAKAETRDAQQKIDAIKRNRPVEVKTHANTGAAQGAINSISGKTVKIEISPSIIGTWEKTFTVHVKRTGGKIPSEDDHTGGMVTGFGPIYRRRGGIANNPMFKRQGTDTVPAMLTPGEYVHNREAVKYFGVDFMRKINHKDLTGALETFGSSAKGKYGTVGPKNKGGLTLTGEAGFEIAWLPSESKSMILGKNGPQMVDLPSDAVVYSHEQSKKIIRQKSVPAGSHREPGPPNKNKNKDKDKGNNSDSGSTDTSSDDRGSGNGFRIPGAKKIKEVIEKSGKITSWWWNHTKQVEAIQRRIDSLAKKFEKTLTKVGATLSGVTRNKDNLNYYNKLNQQIKTNTTMQNRATNELRTLDHGYSSKRKGTKGYNYSTVSYEVTENTYKKKDKNKISKKEKNKIKKAWNKREAARKKYGKNSEQFKEANEKYREVAYKKTSTKKTKKSKVNLSPYVYFDEETGAYQVNYKKINRDFGKNKSKAKAVKEAAENKVEEAQNRRNTAKENIEKAKEALEKIGVDLYNTFFAWETELTKIWNITQKITRAEEKRERASGYLDMARAQVGAGFDQGHYVDNKSGKIDVKFTNKILHGFAKELKALTYVIKNQATAIDTTKKDLLKLTDPYRNETTIKNLKKKVDKSEKAKDKVDKAKEKRDKAKEKRDKAKTKRDKAKKERDAAKKEMDEAKKKYGKGSKQYKEAKAKWEDKKNKYTTANEKYTTANEKYKEAKAAYNKINKEYKGKVKSGEYLNEEGIAGTEEYIKKLREQREIEKLAKKKYVKFSKRDDGTITVDFDTEKFEADKEAGKINETTAKGIQEYVQSVVDKSSELNQLYTDLTESITDLYQILADLREQWADYGEQLRSALEDQQDEQLDRLRKLFDSVNKGLKDLLDGVRKSLDQRRKQEDNLKKEQDISKKQQRLAALQADTSGGHQVEIAQLQQEIADSQQEYQRTLEDQLLDRLSDQADQAAAQRDRLIELQEALLQQQIASTVNDWMRDPVKYQNVIRQAYYSQQDYNNLTSAEQEMVRTNFQDLYGGLLTNQSEQEATTQAIGSVDSSLKLIEESMDALTEVKIETIPESVNNTNATPAAKPAAKPAVAPAGSPEKSIVSSAALAPLKTPPVSKVTETTSKIGLPAGKTKTDYYTDFLKQRTSKTSKDKNKGKIGPDGIKKLMSLKSKNKSEYDVLVDLVNYGGKDSLLYGKWDKVLEAYIKYKGSEKAAYNAIYKDYVKGTTKSNKNNRKGKWNAAFKTPKYRYYKTGGLATQTGPAWLDGTPSKPELVLNATDTENFIALRDVLSKAMGSSNSINNNSTETAMYEININVDHINSDYDVDKIAERVKKDIVQSSSYRNVTQARSFR